MLAFPPAAPAAVGVNRQGASPLITLWSELLRLSAARSPAADLIAAVVGLKIERGDGGGCQHER